MVGTSVTVRSFLHNLAHDRTALHCVLFLFLLFFHQIDSLLTAWSAGTEIPGVGVEPPAGAPAAVTTTPTSALLDAALTGLQGARDVPGR